MRGIYEGQVTDIKQKKITQLLNMSRSFLRKNKFDLSSLVLASVFKQVGLHVFVTVPGSKFLLFFVRHNNARSFVSRSVHQHSTQPTVSGAHMAVDCMRRLCCSCQHVPSSIQIHRSHSIFQSFSCKHSQIATCARRENKNQ